MGSSQMKPPLREMTPAAPAVTGVARRAGQKRRAWVAAAALLALAAGTLVASPAAGQTTTGTEVRIVARQLSSGTVEFGLQQRQADDPWGFHYLPRLRYFPTGAEVDRWLGSSPLALNVGGVRIVARELADGKIEFGLQQRQADGTWGSRQPAPSAALPHQGPGQQLAPELQAHPHQTPTHKRGLPRHPHLRQHSYLHATPPPPQHTPTSTNTPSDPAGTDTHHPPTPRHLHAGVRRQLPYLRAEHRGEPSSAGATTKTGRLARPDGTFTAVSAGLHHSCGVRTDGTIACWGSNRLGQATPLAGGVHGRRRRRPPYVRAAHRRHHHLLGQQRQQASG